MNERGVQRFSDSVALSMNAVLIDRRKYRLKARAERQRQTRERIVAATVALHREVGPARTTIADIARRARVQRLTVYNNFPELRDLLGACQRHFLAKSPPPDLTPNVSRKQSLAGLEKTLAYLYGWYRANQAMQRNVQRDRELVPDLDDLMRKSSDTRLDAAAATYAELIGSRPAVKRQLRSLLRLALEFRTWEVLAGQGMRDGEIAKLLRGVVAAVSPGT